MPNPEIKCIPSNLHFQGNQIIKDPQRWLPFILWKQKLNFYRIFEQTHSLQILI